MSLDWDKLRIFHSVASAGSFTHAAQSLGLNQSSISRQISTLEDSLGVALFHRHARGLLLTEQGEILYRTTLDVYEKLVMIEGQLTDTKDKVAGPLTVTVSEFLGAGWLAPKIQTLLERYPALKLTFILDNKILNLGMREADAAIRLYEPEQQDLIKRKISSIRFNICGSENYFKTHSMPKKPIDLLDHLMIGYPPETPDIPHPHAHANWLFDLAGIDPRHSPNILMMNSMLGIRKMVESGVGLACLPDFIIRSSENLQPCLEHIDIPPIDVFFVYPEERRNSARINAFRDFMLEAVQNIKA